MAANYWDSTQRKYWTFTKQQLAQERRKNEEADRALVQQFPLPDRRLLSIHFNHQLCKLARPLSVRQQAIATAQIYVRRFYLKVEIRRTNPTLVLATALYLACKMEECPQHIRMVLAEARHCWDTTLTDTSKLGECEFSLISELNSQLIIHHPYRALAEYTATFALSAEESALAWSIVNDHYLTDLPLLHPPHVIAVTAIFLAVVLKPTQGGLGVSAQGVQGVLQSLSATMGQSSPARGGGAATSAPGTPGGSLGGGGGAAAQNRMMGLVSWLAESSVDIEAVVDAMQELLSLYEIWEQFTNNLCKDQIAKFVKARGLDK
ncbi:C/H/G cyclin [Mytilinidion resinicola]|uniref:RNA polymerase II holoenzyme cyclin-like subunit n=1 Tax=Mytilinidion resinicola TaxID=574789 RepID=A0A6A6YZV9_9PEZI|nr:C/H/G cyclin [Mytilinidion resinicola]KAF2813507.1 C/H/G cyclin [Mytilinidion resinicola]